MILARAYQRLDNLRTNHHWQLAHDLCNQYDGLVFETLHKIDQWTATSKTCSHCGARFDNLTLADRWVTCDCGLSCDRDHNAAKNIHKVGTSTFGLVDVRQDEVYTLPAIRV